MIIFISGKQGSGKTTLSQYLKDVLEGKGINVQIMKFASPLYLMHNEVRRVLQGFDPNNTLGYDFDKKTERFCNYSGLIGVEIIFTRMSGQSLR